MLNKDKKKAGEKYLEKVCILSVFYLLFRQKIGHIESQSEVSIQPKLIKPQRGTEEFTEAHRVLYGFNFMIQIISKH